MWHRRRGRSLTCTAWARRASRTDAASHRSRDGACSSDAAPCSGRGSASGTERAGDGNFRRDVARFQPRLLAPRAGSASSGLRRSPARCSSAARLRTRAPARATSAPRRCAPQDGTATGPPSWGASALRLAGKRRLEHVRSHWRSASSQKFVAPKTRSPCALLHALLRSAAPAAAPRVHVRARAQPCGALLGALTAQRGLVACRAVRRLAAARRWHDAL